MLAKSKRLTKDDFEPVMTRGTVYHSPHFLLRTMGAPAEAYAVLVSKKVAAGAVDRNRIRRRIYSLLHTLLPLITKKTHTVISAKPGAQKLSYSTQETEIKALLDKAHLGKLQ